jgi:hypothetical protein
MDFKLGSKIVDQRGVVGAEWDMEVQSPFGDEKSMSLVNRSRDAGSDELIMVLGVLDAAGMAVLILNSERISPPIRGRGLFEPRV